MIFLLPVLKFLRLPLFTVLILMVSCKSTKSVTGGAVDASLSSKKIIQNHYANEADFKTLGGRVKIEYANGEDESGVSVNFRMKKDEIIWMSAPLGVVKAYITPEKVSFYNKLEGEYFEGDFGYLSTFVGVELDFYQLQNVLLGNAISDLRKDKYSAETNKTHYMLKTKQISPLFKTLFLLEPKSFRIFEQQLAQPLKKRLLNINYKYQLVEKNSIPERIKILAIEDNSENSITLEFKNMEFDRDLNFPYKIPKGFKQIELSK